jgi:hypothetical protein
MRLNKYVGAHVVEQIQGASQDRDLRTLNINFEKVRREDCPLCD